MRTSCMVRKFCLDSPRKSARDATKAGELDDILKLADREPDASMLDALDALGLKWISGTALEARMVLDLASEYGSLEWEMEGFEIAQACAAAMKDPAFNQPTISNDTLGLAPFHWPKTKMREWAASGTSGAGSSYRRTAKAGGQGKGCLIVVALAIAGIVAVTSAIAALLGARF